MPDSSTSQNPDASPPGNVDLQNHVVIIGAGFGGLACAEALGGRGARVTVVDRNNYHLFVPLLYQVATAALSPADIAEPIRKILHRHKNIQVVLEDVVGIDTEGRKVRLADGGAIGYDRLVIATGSAENYFGHDDWAAEAPGLKSLTDARAIRARVLLGFERAERSADREEQAALTTIVIVGGGPTGVEMAGAVAELAKWSLQRDFRHIDPRTATIMLVEAGPRLLSGFPDELADFARRKLEKLGVQVLTGQSVKQVDAEGAVIGDRRVRAHAVIWAAGVKASPAADWLGIEGEHHGRIPVDPDLSVKGLHHVYAIGDTAFCPDEKGKSLPALAQVAHQQGEHLGRALAVQLEKGKALPPFRFHDRGNTAVIGRSAAVFDFGKWHLKGWFAWILWAIVHIYLLVGFEKRILVATQWLWRWLTYQRGARLILCDYQDRPDAGSG
ncbi:MAG TPA: NAD(P)/FAD-dependent oxidoreductase [Sphingomonas sp.]|nr:NAD(P)/FAD-dependent oxidoreductase [Sphingomonas sp.]